MKLILVRHGTSVLESENPAKPLSDRGKQEIGKVAGFLKQAGIRVDEVWHSSKKRAQETAELIASVVGVGNPLKEIQNIGPNDPIDPFAGKIKKFSSENPERTLMVIGHLPFLAKLAALLLTGSSSSDLIAFPSGGTVCLDQAAGQWWQLEWIVIPELIPQPCPAR